MRYDVSVIGLYILDVLGRPVVKIPDRGNVDFIEEILRKQGTERPGSSPLLKEHRKGIFACAGCDLPLFDASTKFRV